MKKLFHKVKSKIPDKHQRRVLHNFLYANIDRASHYELHHKKYKGGAMGAVLAIAAAVYLVYYLS